MGKAIGLNGALKLHHLSDFPEQFKSGLWFDVGSERLCVRHFDAQKQLIFFDGIDDKEHAQALTNELLYTSSQATMEQIVLKDGEFFWFEIIGFVVEEDSKTIGKVIDIERMGAQDYLRVEFYPQKNILVPYIDRYIVDVVKSEKKIITQDVSSLIGAL